MWRDEVDIYADQGCKWLDVYGDIPEDEVPVERREEAARLLAEACEYFGLPPMTVRWRAWQRAGVSNDTRADPERRAAAWQAREEELRLRDRYDPMRWGWVPDRDPRPSAIHLRADLPDYPLAAAVRYAATCAYQVWAGFDKQLNATELHHMAMDTITGLPKTYGKLERLRREGHTVNVCFIAPDGRQIRPLNPPWRMAPHMNRAMRRHLVA